MASVPYARVASLTSITVLMRGIVTPFIYSAKKTNVILFVKIFSSMAAIVTYSLLIKNYGLFGASWGYVLCPLYFAVFALFFFKYRWKTTLLQKLINKVQ